MKDLLENLETHRLLLLGRHIDAVAEGKKIRVMDMLDAGRYEELIDFARNVGIDVDHYDDSRDRLEYAVSQLEPSVFNAD